MTQPEDREAAPRRRVPLRPYLLMGLFLIGLPLAGFGVANWLTAQKAAVERAFTGPVREFEGHEEPEGYVLSVAFSPDGRRCLSGGEGKTLKLWDVASGECARTMSGHTSRISLVEFSLDGRQCRSGAGGTVKTWNAETGECVRTIRIDPKTGYYHYNVESMAFSPDGRQCLTASADCKLRLWDLETGECRRTMSGHKTSIISVAFGPDGRRALSGGGLGSIGAVRLEGYPLKLWNLETGKCLRTMRGHDGRVFSVAFSPDGRRGLSRSYDGTLKLWALETGKCLRTMRGHARAVVAVSFSPDGRRCASGSWDGTFRLWNLESGREIGRFTGHARASAVAFSPDGRHILSGGGHVRPGWRRPQGVGTALGPPPTVPELSLWRVPTEFQLRIWRLMGGKPEDLGLTGE